MKKIFFSLFLLVSLNAMSEETGKDKKVKIDFSGFLKYDIMYNTRQTVNTREGNFILYPEQPVWDAENNDINAVSNLNMCTINSTLRLNMDGPDIFKANTNAFFEVDFWGSESNKYIDLNHVRIRHAYVKLNWEKTELIFGQYWNPMSAPGFFPRVVSSNCGVPFHPISRNPQLRISQQLGLLKLIGCLFTQRDFTSTGPDGPDTKYLRNANVPNMHLQVQYGKENSPFAAGIGVDYKIVVPELYATFDDKTIKTGKKNSLSSLSFVGFMAIETRYLSVRMQGLYARNAHDLLMLGGYAEKEVTNIEKGEKEFSNLNTVSVWGDVQTTGKKIKYGLFCGYTKNNGAGEKINGPIYARGANIDNVFRISPRIVYEIQPIAISLECEYTTADYGTENGDLKGGITDTDLVANWRTLLSVKYSF